MKHKSVWLFASVAIVGYSTAAMASTNTIASATAVIPPHHRSSMIELARDAKDHDRAGHEHGEHEHPEHEHPEHEDADA